MRKWLLPVLLSPLLLLGAGCFGGGNSVELPPVTLEYWRIQDAETALSEPIEAYKKLHPNVDVNITIFREDEYEEKLLAALAEDRGPDMFSIPNVWLSGWKNKLFPLPKETTIPTRVVNEQKQVVTVNQKTATLTIRQLIDQYVEAVPGDVIMLSPTENAAQRAEDVIYGLPLSFDTLAMFYNVDLLRKADIENPPQTWRDFQDQSKRLTVRNDEGEIEISGSGMGLSKNVRHSSDIITAIMLQNGAEMAGADGYARFDRYTPATQDNPFAPGVEGLIFYQSFAREGTSTFSWSTMMPDSLDAFIAGQSAFYFGYPIDQTIIKERAPRLDFGVTQLPQVDTSRKANIAHYNVEVVSKKTKQGDVAWDLIQFLARRENVQPFLEATARPTALRGLISDQLTDPRIEPFVQQVLTGKTWYKGKDWESAVKAFDVMLESYPTIERPEYRPIVSAAANLVNTTIR